MLNALGVCPGFRGGAGGSRKHCQPRPRQRKSRAAESAWSAQLVTSPRRCSPPPPPWCAVGRALSAAWRQPATRPSKARRLSCQRPRSGGERRFAAQATKRRRGRTARCPPCGRKPIKNKAVARPRDDRCDRVAQRLGQRTTKRGRRTVQWRKSGLGDPPRATPRANDDSLTSRDVGARVGHGRGAPLQLDGTGGLVV